MLFIIMVFIHTGTQLRGGLQILQYEIKAAEALTASGPVSKDEGVTLKTAPPLGDAFLQPSAADRSVLPWVEFFYCFSFSMRPAMIFNYFRFVT